MEVQEDFASVVRARLEACGVADACSGLELRRYASAPADAVVFFHEPDLLSGPGGAEVIRALSGDGLATVTRQRGGALTLRLDDALVRAAGAALERGVMPRGRPRGGTCIVNFIDPNAVKALHIGHLRNVVYGHAIASVLAAAGTRVMRHSLVCDIGRTIGEMLAGYEQYGELEGAGSGRKSDHVIGACYARYVHERFAGQTDRATPSSLETREDRVVHDPAEAYAHRWQQGDARTRELWSRAVAGVLDGHRTTLERLGVRLDRSLYQSQAVEESRALIRQGLESGCFSRTPDGAVIYRSGREEYDTMVLVRTDGLATEYGRCIGMLDHFATRYLDGIDYVLFIVGDEWRPATDLYEEILYRLTPSPVFRRSSHLYHGMVLVEGSKMRSSDGKAILVDELLDQVEREPKVQALVARAEGAISAAEAADFVVRAPFLARKPHQTIEFSWDRLLSETDNPGWTLARAFAALSAAARRDASPPADPRAYRLAVFEAHRFASLVDYAARDRSVTGLMAGVRRISERYQGDDVPAGEARVMRTTLLAYYRSLGFLAGDRAGQPVSRAAPELEAAA
ncbi:MAG TPA: arginine--tRNA ligase [Longimicrobium sp.]